MSRGDFAQHWKKTLNHYILLTEVTKRDFPEMRIAIVQFPGSTNVPEMAAAITRAEMVPVEFVWDSPWEKLAEMDGYVFIGDSSHACAHDPFLQVMNAQSEKGKAILGVGLGGQLLVAAGWVPGLENNKAAISLVDVRDPDTSFSHVRLSAHYQRNAYTRYLNHQSIVRLQGMQVSSRFVISNALLQEVQAQGLNVFQYCDASGVVIKQTLAYLNSAIDHIAAVSNKMGNVMALLPQLESTEGCDAIFQSMRDYIKEGRVIQTAPLSYYPRKSR